MLQSPSPNDKAKQVKIWLYLILAMFLILFLFFSCSTSLTEDTEVIYSNPEGHKITPIGQPQPLDDGIDTTLKILGDFAETSFLFKIMLYIFPVIAFWQITRIIRRARF